MKVKCLLKETCEITAKILGAEKMINPKVHCSHAAPHKYVRACDNDICKYYVGVEIPGVKCGQEAPCV